MWQEWKMIDAMFQNERYNYCYSNVILGRGMSCYWIILEQFDIWSVDTRHLPRLIHFECKYTVNKLDKFESWFYQNYQ